MKSKSEKIRSLAESAGANMVGFAPVERFAAGPEGTRPTFDYTLSPSSASRTGPGAGASPRK